MSGSRELAEASDLAATALESEPGSDGTEQTDAEPVASEGDPTAAQRTNQGRHARSAG